MRSSVLRRDRISTGGSFAELVTETSSPLMHQSMSLGDSDLGLYVAVLLSVSRLLLLAIIESTELESQRLRLCFS